VLDDVLHDSDYCVASPLIHLLTGECDTMKWYGHSEDMRKLSCEFPTALFTLSGEGEESGDIWRKYYKGGKCQIAQAEIKMADFDPEKLA
jgi:hypothetical protein